MDGHFFTVDVGEQQTDLRSHISLVGVLEFTVKLFQETLKNPQ